MMVKDCQITRLVQYVWASQELEELHGACLVALFGKLPDFSPVPANTSTALPTVLFFAYVPRPRILLPSDQITRLKDCARASSRICSLLVTISLEHSGDM
jgi:hypothetical protein